MITETGRVVAIEKKGLWVETIRKTTCGSCSVQKGCGHGVLNKLGSKRSNHIRVLYDEQCSTFAVDDEVSIGIPEQLIVAASFIVYMIPLLSLLLGAVAGGALLQAAWGETVAGIVGAVSGFLIGLGLVKWHGSKTYNSTLYQPRLLGLVASPVSIIKNP